jgi:actin-related protein 5
LGHPPSPELISGRRGKMASHRDVPSRYKNVRYRSDLYLEEVPTEAYVREAGTFPAVGDDHESIVIDNGTSRPSLGSTKLNNATGTSHLRAGFASHSQPFINEPNQAARFTSRKSVKMAFFGRDCEADSTAKGYVKPVFDGDILLSNELLVRPVPSVEVCVLIIGSGRRRQR